MTPLQWALRWVAQEGDDEAATERKRIVLGIATPTLPLLLSVWAFTRSFTVIAAHCFLLGCGVLHTILLGYLLCTHTMPQRLLEWALVGYMMFTIVGDWGSASELGEFRLWSTAVPIMDALLAIGAHTRVQGLCLHSLAVWLIMSGVEDGARLGLYDIAGWTENDGQIAQVRQRLECHNEQYSNLPCAVGWSTATVQSVFFLCILYVDFFATRGFAEGQRREQRRVRLMVDAAEQVAACLVQFDLSAAEQALDRAGVGGLPLELGRSFRSLLANLNRYRPYLPQSCFCDAHTGSDAEDTPGEECAAAEPERAGSVVADVLRPESIHSLASASSAGSAPPARVWSSPADGGPGMCTPPTASARKGHTAHHKRVTLLAVNRCGLLAELAAPGDAASCLSQWVSREVGGFTAAVLAQKGVVDLMSGDHLSASFGALGCLGAHRVAAVRCAWSLAAQSSSAPPTPGTATGQLSRLSRAQRTAAVATGAATCGDFGSRAAQRFMVIGGVSAFLATLERIAAGWRTPVLLDGVVHDDAQLHWDCRLRKVLTHTKLSGGPVPLWEVCAEKGAARTSQTEWMYEMSAAPSNPWTGYNTAVQLWCRVGADAAQVAVDAACAAALDHPQEVLDALAALRAAREASGLAVQCDLPAAAGVGDPSPVTLCLPDAAQHC
eukprot:TRINITY_DN2303_c0_g7_i1.p1 TRINITY_DN2303_c0_g7~~TRINITY_DN2303_c0_g7_i1.p1  ORF type:complete len:666 (+),score=114.42 TRINITY_DN2303_c0_g7_i1:82-2079(+)